MMKLYNFRGNTLAQLNMNCNGARSQMFLIFIVQYSTIYKDKIVKEFWDKLYSGIEEKMLPNKIEGYNFEVFKKLEQYKMNNNMHFYNGTDIVLIHLQKEIENLSFMFNEPSIYQETPNLIKIFIRMDKISAKSYLFDKIPEDLYNEEISHFGEYTLEALMIYVLGLAFSSIQESSIVRVSTLLGLLERSVRTQAHIFQRNKKDGSRVDSGEEDAKKMGSGKKKNDNIIASKLLDFMVDREVLHMELLETDNKPVVKKKGQGYINKNLFAVCNFDLSHLPMKLNLPMVCYPLDWYHPKDIEEGNRRIRKQPLLLSDLRGGYLSGPTLYMYGLALLSSHNLSNFNIELNESKYKEMCSTLNGLQIQGFKVNSKMLDFIKKNRTTFERQGILMPGILAHVNQKEVLDLLRQLYFMNKEIKGVYSVDALIKECAVMIQKARYEEFLIMLASAYEGFVFYLPAFMDFRGRIYRSGILHFHERDISKSLLLFYYISKGVFENLFLTKKEEEEVCNQSVNDIVASAAALKYKKFYHYDEALKWYKDKENQFHASDESLISFAKDASDPFQFIAKVLCKDTDEANTVPITQDAAASAYQIMSYLLLNEEMSRKTNLIPHPDGKIQDVYVYILEYFRYFLHYRFEDKIKMEIIESKLDRKLIKKLFMPLIYGKTLISMDNDIRETYGQMISNKDSYHIAKLSQEFWHEAFPDIANLMKLINKVSWLCSAKDSPVYYSIPYFTTKQDYMQFIKESISLYERHTRKRRRATLSIATTNRDKRKTKTSTCANFIHQKDAYIALTTVKPILEKYLPIYTVHDNFLTTPRYAKLIPDIYIKAFIGMGHPLHIINNFIHVNLILPYSQTEDVRIYISKDDPKPFPSVYLEKFLLSISPTTEKKKWDKGVSELLQCYEYYVAAVGGNRWDEFQHKLVNRSTNFSVHY